MCKISVSSMDEKSVLNEIEAYSVPFISANSSAQYFDKTEMSEIFGIPDSEIHREPGPIDLLIGINEPTVHEARDEETRFVDKLALRKSILGYIIYGTDTVEKSKSHFGNIMYSESDIKRFWETEQFGVQINWCCQLRRPGEKLKTALEKKEESEIRSTARQVGNQAIGR